MSLRERRALVVHRDDDAQNPQRGIRARAHLLDRLEQVVGALEREVRRLNRDEQMRGRHQRVDRQQAERRRAVDDNVRIFPPDGSSLSLRRKCASISPTSFASSLASAIRDGAIHRFSTWTSAR